jgi:hypothetical protein
MLPDGQSDNDEPVAAALQQEMVLFRQALLLSHRPTPLAVAPGLVSKLALLLVVPIPQHLLRVQYLLPSHLQQRT